MSANAADSPDFVPPPAGEIMGHPKALWNLFGAEFWERFCYYGMRAVLAPYVALAFFSHLGDDAESAALLAAGAQSVGLGGLVLRVETAAVVGVHALAWRDI